MGGPTKMQCGKMAHCGGEPSPDWSKVESPLDPAMEDPLPAQLRSKDLKAAVAQLKRAEGIHSSNEKKFVKKDGDVNDFGSQLFRKFVVNGMDSIAH